MQSAEQLAQIAKVLSVDTRVRILQLLKQREMCVGALAVRLGVTQGAVSQHLRILKDAGLVTPDKRGYYVHYRINEEAFAQCRELLDGLLSTAPSGSEEEKHV